MDEEFLENCTDEEFFEALAEEAWEQTPHFESKHAAFVDGFLTKIDSMVDAEVLRRRLLSMVEKKDEAA